MLQRDDVGAIVQGSRRAQVVGGLLGSDPVMDLRGIEGRLVRGMQDGNLATAG
jgi:hypothetical protein